MERKHDPWVSECGTAAEEELAERCRRTVSEWDGQFLALLTDGILCGRARSFEKALPRFGRVLELRIFTAQRELWAHRSMLGQRFAWRVADDGFLARQLSKTGGNGYFDRPESYRSETIQYLDIDETYVPSGTPRIEGNRLLRTTGGGRYELPLLQGQDAVRLVQYVRYDEPACAARHADFRIMGFEEARHER